MPQQGRACQRLADTPGTPSSALPRPLARRQCVGRGFGLGRGSLFLLNRKPQRCNIIATRFYFGTDGIFGTYGIRTLFAAWFNAARMSWILRWMLSRLMPFDVSTEERSVGTAGVSTCKSRWVPYH